jgi:hypothetical protein
MSLLLLLSQSCRKMVRSGSVLTLHLHVIFVLLKFLLKFLCVIEHSRQLHRATSNILCKLNKVIHTVDDLHLKHRQLAESYQKERFKCLEQS